MTFVKGFFIKAILIFELKNKLLIKISLLIISMMTMMAGAVVAPSLPQISNVFKDVNNVELLSRLVITLPALFIAFSSPFFGYFSDRWGRKKLLLFSLVIYGIAGVSGYFLSDIYLILTGRAVLGISVGGIMTIATTLVGDYFKGNERNEFAGLQGAFMGIGGVLFITISGWFADIHWQLPFLIYLFAIPGLIMGALFLYETKKVVSYPKIKANNNSYDKRKAILIYTLAFVGIVFFYMVPVQIPFLLSKMQGISNSQIGYSISIATLSGAIVSINYKTIKMRFGFRSVFQLAFIFLGLGYLAVYEFTSYLGITFALFIAGIGIGLLMPTSNLWIMAIAPEEIRGTLVGRTSMATFLGMFFSPIIIQPVINKFDVSVSFLFAFFCLLALCLLLFLFKNN